MTEQPVKVSVVPRFLPEQSHPEHGKYAFAYHVTIENQGSEPTTLISRHWIITDSEDNRQEVRGDGVVGEQPRIEPGRRHSYTSGVVLDTPVGTMEGSYQMQYDSGDEFDAPIAPFLLAIPGSIN